MEVFDGWKPAEDALPPPAWFPEGREGLGPTMSTGETVDLVQDAATDCSVVASLCAGIARTERGHTRVGTNVSKPRHSLTRVLDSARGDLSVGPYTCSSKDLAQWQIHHAP